MPPAEPEETTGPGWDSPEAILDALRDHPEWTADQRDDALDALVARFPPEALAVALRPRLWSLGGGDAEAMLRIVEADGSAEVLAALAHALIAQPALPPDRAWDALAVLDAHGRLDDHPELAERWHDLNEALGDDAGTLEELAAQLEGDPEEAWMALQGLGTVEPDVRAAIVQGLSGLALGPGLIEFLRLLAHASDTATRDAALAALDRTGADRENPRLAAAWSSLAHDHPSPDVAEKARRWLAAGTAVAVAGSRELGRAVPVLVRSLVTALNGAGQGSVVLASRSGHRCVTAAFLCDVQNGVLDAFGQVDDSGQEDDSVFEEVATQSELEQLTGAHELALGFLAGALMLSVAEAPPALRFWLEGTVGASFRPRPLAAPFPGWDPSSVPLSEMPSRVDALLSACPSWIDDSPLTYSLAEELLLRNGRVPADPVRDAGAFRYLFEHRLSAQLELYRRMLLGMASFWQAAGDSELGHTALALAWQLTDPQHAVPSHPFHVALSARSLAAAQDNLERRR
ncbi:MAG: hypothetical protein P4L84_25660 [Isosphaeraceae bacterium]|nr:hypothetical protein [Isosphaeraceae bacterium]